MLDNSTSIRKPALSASRAKDFRQCPLLFRYRVVEQLPEPPAPAAVRGTLVHSVLENLFTLPPMKRDFNHALSLLENCWNQQRQTIDEESLFKAGQDYESWLTEVKTLIERYFKIENPKRLQPAGREEYVEVLTRNQLRLRGIIDRIDVSTDGLTRIVDYKTGKAPSIKFAANALFQMKFYALMLHYRDGVLPSRLQLLYLKDAQTLSFDPTIKDIKKFEIELIHLWENIEHAAQNKKFSPKKTRLCNWCNFKAYCPVFGGNELTIYNEERLTDLLNIRVNIV